MDADEWRDVIRDGFEGAVGKTPLIRLRSLCLQTGCEIYGKAEWMQPGGTVLSFFSKNVFFFFFFPQK